MSRFWGVVALVLALGWTGAARADEGEAAEGSSEDAAAEEPYAYRGVALHAGILVGGVPARESVHGGTRANLTIPLLDWLRADIQGASFWGSQGNQEEGFFGLVLHAGVRFAPWRIGRTTEPYFALRFCHMHEAPRSIWGDHFFSSLAGSSDHGLGHRSGASIALGIDAPLFPSMHWWRIGADVELITMFDEPVIYVNGAVFLGYGF